MINKFELLTMSNILTEVQIKLLNHIIMNYFDKIILEKIKNFERPIKNKYGDFIERNKGRFEITPHPVLENKIWEILFSNNKFKIINKIAKKIIKKNNNEKVIQELCLLPLEPDTEDGIFHRDIFVNSEEDFKSNIFYLTHIIYLDDSAYTEFCQNSNYNSDNNINNYKIKKIKSEPGKMILFDGRLLHRGLKNNSSKPRLAIYISYYKKSYIDQESILPKLFNHQ